MEGREGLPDGVAVAAAAAAEEDSVFAGGARLVNSSDGGRTAAQTPEISATVPGVVGASLVRKKRGRPRKYGLGKSLVRPLNPVPISAFAPERGFAVTMKRSRGRGTRFLSMQALQTRRIEFQRLGESVSCSSGANFTPHIINVAPGEDVTMKVISFSQQGPRAICVLSANGSISNATLRQPDSSGGTLTYEGRFELLSLSGSFMPNESGGTRSRSGGMSVCLSGPDGRIVGGGVAGLLVAAGPVQVVVSSFHPSYQIEQDTKQPRHETAPFPPSPTPITSFPSPAIPISAIDSKEVNPVDQGQITSTKPPQPVIIPAPASFKIKSWTSFPTSPDTDPKNSSDTNIFFSEG